jgi:hypothetical protein
MKKIISLISATVLLSVFTSCGDKKSTEEAIVAPQGMHILDLSKYGKPFVIFVPDTVAAKLEITQQTYGALDIKVGKGFAVSINEQQADIPLRKNDIKEDEINKFKSYIVDEPNAILWESEITKPEFHFLINQKIGNADYSIEDIRNEDGEVFGKDAIQKMYDSAKNIKEVKKVNS